MRQAVERRYRRRPGRGRRDARPDPDRRRPRPAQRRAGRAGRAGGGGDADRLARQAGGGDLRARACRSRSACGATTPACGCCRRSATRPTASPSPATAGAARRGTLHSRLDELAGIGPRRRKLLIQTFGSVQGVREAEPGGSPECPRSAHRAADLRAAPCGGEGAVAETGVCAAGAFFFRLRPRPRHPPQDRPAGLSGCRETTRHLDVGGVLSLNRRGGTGSSGCDQNPGMKARRNPRVFHWGGSVSRAQIVVAPADTGPASSPRCGPGSPPGRVSSRWEQRPALPEEHPLRRLHLPGEPADRLLPGIRQGELKRPYS